MTKEIKTISTDIMQGFSQKYISAMEDTFEKYGVWKRLFSVGKDADETTCLLFCDGKWEVFFSEHDQRIEVEQFDEQSISDACLEMIRRVPEEKDCVTEMQTYYQSLLNKNSKLGFGSKDIERIIQKILPAASLL